MAAASVAASAPPLRLEPVLLSAVQASTYHLKIDAEMHTWREVIDEIYYKVSHAEPWMSGNARGASTAFCLLYKLHSIGPTDKQLTDTLEHVDSPYIRAIGVLYVRYCKPPRELWDWLGRYVDDDEPIAPAENGKEVTMGDYVRDVMLSLYYFETIFPRVPPAVEQDIVAKLQARRLPTSAVGNGGVGGPSRRGGGSDGRPPSVKDSLSVSFGQRAPNRGAREDRGRDDRRGWDRGRDDRRDWDRGRDDRRDWRRERSRSRSRSRERERGGSGAYGAHGGARGGGSSGAAGWSARPPRR